MEEIKLTPKQQAFADYYIETLNATESAKRAGYSEKTASVIANENLNKPYIKAYIENAMASKDNSRIASQEEVLQLLTDIARGVTKSATLKGVGGGEEVIEKEMLPTTAERMKAAELLGKRYALFTDKVDLSAKVTPVFVDDIGSDEDGD